MKMFNSKYRFNQVLTSIILILFLTLPLLSSASYHGWSNPTPSMAGNLSNQSVYAIIRTLVNYLLGFIAVLAIAGIVIAGIMYMTAAGDENRVESAKKMLTYSIVGLAVALIGLVIVIAVNYIISAGDLVT